MSRFDRIEDILPDDNWPDIDPCTDLEDDRFFRPEHEECACDEDPNESDYFGGCA